MNWKHIALIIVGIIAILLASFIATENIVLNVYSILQTLFSFITLMIAMTLFDKYQAGTNLNNQTINLVIEYITFLKKTKLLLNEYISKEKIGFELVSFEKEVDRTKNGISMSKSNLYIYFGTYLDFCSELTKYINSPWMPKKIYDASNFLVTHGSKAYSIDELKGSFCIMYFPGYKDLDAGYKGPRKIIVLDNVDTVEKLKKNIDVLLKNIEKWIKTQATDINIRM